MPPTRYDEINNKLLAIEKLLSAQAPVIERIDALACENSRMLKGANGTKGIDTRLTLVEQSVTKIDAIEDIAASNVNAIQTISNTLNNHIIDEKDRRNKREEMVNKLVVLLVSALITNIGTIITTAILFYLKLK